MCNMAFVRKSFSKKKGRYVYEKRRNEKSDRI